MDSVGTREAEAPAPQRMNVYRPGVALSATNDSTQRLPGPEYLSKAGLHRVVATSPERSPHPFHG